MTKVLITGGTGLLGLNTIIGLTESGYSVKTIVRDKSKFKLNNLPNVEILEGELSDLSFLHNAMKNCDCIIHSASETRQGLPKYSDYFKINVSLTERLMDVAVKNKLKTFIYVSTSNVYGFGTKDSPGDENKKISELFSKSNYVKSKSVAQHLVLSYSSKIDVIIVNPTFMIGAYDQRPSSGRIILMGYKKKVLMFPPGGKNFIDVKDVVKGIINAIQNGRNKETFILASENLTYKEFFTKLNRLTFNNPVMIKIPRVILIFIGFFGSILNLCGIKTEKCLTNMRILCVKNYYTNSKAKRDLSVNFQNIDNAIVDALNWFKINGNIK